MTLIDRGQGSATGLNTAKRYPDGSQVTYAFAPDGLPLTMTKASSKSDVFGVLRGV